jgi:nucleolar protein 4
MNDPDLSDNAYNEAEYGIKSEISPRDPRSIRLSTNTGLVRSGRMFYPFLTSPPAHILNLVLYWAKSTPSGIIDAHIDDCRRLHSCMLHANTSKANAEFGSIPRLSAMKADSNDQRSHQSDARTIFVRGLDVTVNDDLLSETFSSVGPVKHAFTVKKKGSTGHHKGFGFVQFALEEDAVRAVQEMHGTRLAGRAIKLEGARKRATFEERKKEKISKQNTEDLDQTDNGQEAGERGGKGKGEKAPKPQARPKNVNAATEEERKRKHNLVKTVAVGGMKDTDVEGMIKFAKSLKFKGKVLPVVDAIHPVEASLVRQYRLEHDGCSGVVVFLQYQTVKDALSAVRLLHGVQKKFTPGKKSGHVVLWARQVSGDGLYLKKHRVVVRNLPFDVTEEDLKVAFGEYMLWEVTLPRNVDGESRGFAFVGFVSRQDAERAITKINATKIAGRMVAVDWAVSKRDFEDKKKDDAADRGGEDKTPREESGKKKRKEREDSLGITPGQELDEEDGLVDSEVEKSRINNVLDGILGGDDYFEEIEEEDGSDGESHGDTSDDDQSDDECSERAGMSEDSSDYSASDSQASSSEEDDEDGEGKENHGAHDVDEDYLKDAKNSIKDKNVVEKVNRQAEKLQESLAASKSKEPYTVEPGAVVFIRNIPIDATQRTVFEAMKKFGFVKSTRLVLNKQTRRPKGTAFVDFKTADSAKMAAAASQKATEKTGPPVMIAGKPVEIHIALGGDDIRDLAIKKSKGLRLEATTGREKGRNLYLAQEGLIGEGSSAWNQLSNSDREKRARAAVESEMKLKSPNFAVSRTRLNVRNVPKSWDERKLKELFIEAVKARATKENPKIVQTKILTSPTGASKGIAFIEFKNHDHALCALRELNNNPATWSKDHRPIIEFAIDNVQALKKREMSLLKQRDGNAKGSRDAEQANEPQKKKKKKKPEEGSNGEPKSKRKLKMERRQMLKQRTRSIQGKIPPQDGQDAGAKNKSQRRREQRKRTKEQSDRAVDALAKTAVAGHGPGNAATAANPAKTGPNTTPTARTTTKKKRRMSVEERMELAPERPSRRDVAKRWFE